MGAGKFSVGKIIVIVVTCIWIPMNLLLFGVYVQLFGSMKSMVTDNQIGALSVYVKQLEARLGMVENYALSLLSDDAYAGIRNVRGSKNYELTKTEMQLRMSRWVIQVCGIMWTEIMFILSILRMFWSPEMPL